MCNCKVCNKSFEPWDAEFECGNCDDGEEEVFYDWCFDGPEYRTCQTCKGEGAYTSNEYQFCSDDCREDYFNPHSPYNEKHNF